MGQPVVIVHGGAWNIPQSLTKDSVEGCKRAAAAGWNVLSQGGSSLDAVEAAVRVLESEPAFDAGTGSVLNEEGEVEMDSIVMTGQDLKVGAVACVSDVEHPVSLARAVMDKTPHTMIVGKGASKLARLLDIPEYPKEKLVTEEAVKQFEEFKKYNSTISGLFSEKSAAPERPGCDTVGAVALDDAGHIAAATSTGGITAKRVGRVGDSPLVGCGAYADDELGGSSTTGHGEAITRYTLAKRALDNAQKGSSEDSVESVLSRTLDGMKARVDGCGGLIAILPDGRFGYAFSTERMAWAWKNGSGESSGIDE